MKLLSILAPLALLSFTQLSHAVGPGSGNGGDPVGLEFMWQAREAIQLVKDSSSLFPELNSKTLTDKLNGLKVILTEEPIYVDVMGMKQLSVARNDKNPDRILLNRKGWQGIETNRQKQATALHELCGLLNLEVTGDYHISQRLVSKGLTSSQVLALAGKYIWKMESRDFTELVRSTLLEDISETSGVGTPAEVLDGRFLVVSGCQQQNCGYNKTLIVIDSQNPGAMMIVRKQEEALNSPGTQSVILRNSAWKNAHRGNFGHAFLETLEMLKEKGFKELAKRVQEE